MDITDQKFRQIWYESDKPVIVRQGKHRSVLMRFPRSATNTMWIKAWKRNNPIWDGQLECWETPRAWFNDMIQRCLEEYGVVYLVQRHREMQRCAPACWNASGYDCECSCMGANHGSGHPGGRWYVVSDTFAFKWDSRQYACRRIQAPAQAQPIQTAATG